MKENQFPKGWDEERIRRVLAHYEKQSEEEQLAEDEAPFAETEKTLVEVPSELMPLIREILASFESAGS